MTVEKLKLGTTYGLNFFDICRPYTDSVLANLTPLVNIKEILKRIKKTQSHLIKFILNLWLISR